MTTFNWLHFTDLHCGMPDQPWRWPNVREIVFEDLEKLHDKCGDWDLVLFTGDLTFSAQPEQFEQATSVLNALWEQFDKLGCENPLLQGRNECATIAVRRYSWR